MYTRLMARRTCIATTALYLALGNAHTDGTQPPIASGKAQSAPGQTGQVQHTASSLIALLKAADEHFPVEFTVIVEIRDPSRLVGPDFGPCTKLCKITLLGNARALSVDTTYDNPPDYREAGERGADTLDYDSGGNLILWRPTRKWSLSTPNFNISRDDQEMLLINPAGHIVEEHQHTQYYRFPLGSLDSAYEFHQFQLASGRGFTKRLSEDPRLNVLRDGTLRIVVSGRYSGSFVGQWELVAAPAGRSVLTRVASFTSAGHMTPAIRVRTSGVFESDGITLAQTGSITWPGMGNHTLDFTIISFSRDPDAGHLKELEDLLRPPLPEGAHVIDMRKDRSQIPQPRERD